MKMLVVASPTLDPLSGRHVPVPTDGQPEWWRCAEGHRERDRLTLGGCAARDRNGPCGHITTPDGPCPFNVAVWQEVATCGACGSRFPWPPQRLGPTCELHASGHCEPWDNPVGAVVATVEATDRSHHADECHAAGYTPQFCHPDALPGHWHTPTSTVTRLDVPIPTERPVEVRDVLEGPGLPPAVGDDVEVPAPWWWADLDLEVGA